MTDAPIHVLTDPEVMGPLDFRDSSNFDKVIEFERGGQRYTRTIGKLDVEHYSAIARTLQAHAKFLQIEAETESEEAKILLSAGLGMDVPIADALKALGLTQAELTARARAVVLARMSARKDEQSSDGG